MDSSLRKALNTKTSWRFLQNNINKPKVKVSAKSNILSLISEYDKRIAIRDGAYLHVDTSGWRQICELVKRESGVDILKDNLDALSEQTRTENSVNIKNEKSASKAPTHGFIEFRLLGDNTAITAGTLGEFNRKTPANAYEGSLSTRITNWRIESVVVVENFDTFVSITEQQLKKVIGLEFGAFCLVLFRGFAKANISSAYDQLSGLTAKKYLFFDYDLSGLALAESMAVSISEDAFILPYKPVTNKRLVDISKDEQRGLQSRFKATSDALSPYYNHIKDCYLAITQESLIANDIILHVVPVSKPKNFV